LGTNATISGGGPFALSNFTLISSGPLGLPTARQDGGNAALDISGGVSTNTHQTLNFANTTAYKILFPTVFNEAAANSMQVGEVKLDGTIVPEPSACSLLGLALTGMFAARRRRGTR
jgi:hypothetical protein